MLKKLYHIFTVAWIKAWDNVWGDNKSHDSIVDINDVLVYVTTIHVNVNFSYC